MIQNEEEEIWSTYEKLSNTISSHCQEEMKKNLTSYLHFGHDDLCETKRQALDKETTDKLAVWWQTTELKKRKKICLNRSGFPSDCSDKLILLVAGEEWTPALEKKVRNKHMLKRKIKNLNI